MNPPPLPVSESDMPCIEDVLEFRANVKKVTKFLADNGITILPPPYLDRDDLGGFQFWDLMLDDSDLKTFSKILRLGVQLLPSEIKYEQILDEFNAIEEIESEYFPADSCFRETLKTLKSYGDFSRLPTAEERKVYLPFLYKCGKEGTVMFDDEIAMLAHAKSVNADYVTNEGVFSKPASSQQNGSSGCAGMILLMLTPAFCFIAYRSLT